MCSNAKTRWLGKSRCLLKAYRSVAMGRVLTKQKDRRQRRRCVDIYFRYLNQKAGKAHQSGFQMAGKMREDEQSIKSFQLRLRRKRSKPFTACDHYTKLRNQFRSVVKINRYDRFLVPAGSEDNLMRGGAE